MANYRDIKGFTIQSTSSDPVPYSGSWASAPSMNTARSTFVGYGASSTAAGAVNGYMGPPGITANNELYNGTAWTEVGDTPTANAYNAGGGSTTSALITGGDGRPANPVLYATSTTWNGTGWTEVAEMSTVTAEGYGTGVSSTAILVTNGRKAPYPTLSQNSETWDGSSWTNTNDTNSTGTLRPLTGTVTAALVASNSPNSTNVELWNGTSWTETTNMSNFAGGGGSAGTSTEALVTRTTKTESWNGTSWTEVNTIASARNAVGNGNNNISNNTTALIYGGETPPGTMSAATEEWSFPSGPSFLVEGDMWYNSALNALKVYGKEAGITSGAWAAGGNLNTARGNLGHSGSGTQTASIVYGGNIPPGGAGAVNESYNGTAWTEVGDLPGVRDQMISFGTSTAAIAADGTDDNGTTYITTTASWNGTSWTAVPANVNTNTRQRGSAGTQTAGLGAAGEPGGKTNNELWDGSAWTEASDVNTGGQQRRGAGTQTAAILVSVYPNSGIHEQWDGTSWTETTDLNTARAYASTSGSQTNAISFGGNPQPKAQTEHWNGTSWTELADLGTYRSDHSATGSAVAALCIGGSQPPGYISATEEWTAVSAVATVTTS